MGYLHDFSDFYGFLFIGLIEKEKKETKLKKTKKVRTEKSNVWGGAWTHPLYLMGILPFPWATLLLCEPNENQTT